MRPLEEGGGRGTSRRAKKEYCCQLELEMDCWDVPKKRSVALRGGREREGKEKGMEGKRRKREKKEGKERGKKSNYNRQ